MKDIIINELKKIEKIESIKILFAIESGSRAWNFPSKDSDYDVRFIYIRPIDYYLSIDHKKDVLEYPINNLLDISGWDLTKTLQLFNKSNPSIMEWINSPIIYLDNYSLLENLRNLSPEYFSRKASMYHYLNMAKTDYKLYFHKDLIRVKKYFYVLRALLACMWLEEKETIPPMDFEELLSSQVQNAKLLDEINNLLLKKRNGDELDIEPKITIINSFVDEKIIYYKNLLKNISDNKSFNISKLDTLFRQTLYEVW